jgi:hypothetical protein
MFFHKRKCSDISIAHKWNAVSRDGNKFVKVKSNFTITHSLISSEIGFWCMTVHKILASWFPGICEDPITANNEKLTLFLTLFNPYSHPWYT